MVINEPVLGVQRRAPEHSSARYFFSVAWPRFHKGVLHVQSTHALAAMHRLDEPSGKRRLWEGKISLLEAEMLPDRKHILKKKRCKYSHVVTLLVLLRRTDCLRVIWLMFELFRYERHAIISWNLPKCYSIWIIKCQRAEIGVTYTFHSRWFISLSR